MTGVTKAEALEHLKALEKKVDEGRKWKREYDELAKQTDIRVKEAVDKMVLLERQLSGLTRLRDALRELFEPLIPVGQPAAGSFDITHAPTEVTVMQADPLKKSFDTKDRRGQIMFVLVHDLKKPSTEAMIGEQMAEYTWPSSHNALKDVLSALVRENWLVKDESHPALYHTPSMVTFEPRGPAPEKK
jgi:hypothetical protein